MLLQQYSDVRLL